MRAPEAEPFLAHLPEAERFATFHLVLVSGGVLSGGDAGPVLLRNMRGMRMLGQIASALRIRRLSWAIYRSFAANRKRLGRLVPDAPGPHRFP